LWQVRQAKRLNMKVDIIVVFKRSFKYAALIQLFLSALFIISASIRSQYTFRYGLYFSAMFLQFFPVVYILVVFFFLTKALVKKNKSLTED
jgi:hypothetical protein